MKPIFFECESLSNRAPDEIAQQILDLKNWPNFGGYWPIPGIKAAEFEIQTPSVVGTRIRVTNQDGTSHVEEIVEWNPEQTVRLKFSGFSPPLSNMADHFDETWFFQRTKGGTKVTRSFELHPKTRLGRLVLWVLSFFLARAIRRHLREMGVLDTSSAK